MADPLTVIGGIAAVVQLAQAGRDFFKVLRQFARDAGGAAPAVKRFAGQVRAFSGAIEVAERTLACYCMENPESPLVAYIRRHKVLQDVDSEAKSVQAHLFILRDKVSNMHTMPLILASIQWMFKKAEILQLIPEMETVKTTLDLLITTSLLESMNRKLDSALDTNQELRKQIRHLRRIIRRQAKALRELRSQLQQQRSRTRGSASYHSAGHISSKPGGPLMELAHSMYTQGAVPDSPPESPNPSPPPSGADCQFREPRGLRSPPGQPRMARNSNTNTNTNSNGGGGGDSSNTPAPRSSPGESGGAQSHDPPTRARSDSPVTAPVHPAPSSDGTPPPPPSPRPSSPPRQRGSAASSVVVAVPEQQQQQQAAAVGAGRVLRYRDGLVDGSISGYVKSARGSSSPRHWHDVAAVVAGGLDANVISLRRARELKLEVEPPRAGEEGAAAASFDFGTGAPPERSIGTAVFVFKTLSHFNPRHPVITVTCDVCENSPVGLILGKPFVEERERRWSKHPSEG